PDGLKYFTELVVPLLQARNLVRSEYTGSTLRDSFGLSVPTNRYSRIRSQTACA
ncbi:MAG: LLM class flavin-dependent oxidoreductase, partial [Pseudomonas sp.]